MEKPTKSDVERAEIYVDDDQGPTKPVPMVEKTDYSGAHEKTDPREIALVKKLDLWIMVRICGTAHGSTLTSPPTPYMLQCLHINRSQCYSSCTS